MQMICLLFRRSPCRLRPVPCNALLKGDALAAENVQRASERQVNPSSAQLVDLGVERQPVVREGRDGRCKDRPSSQQMHNKHTRCKSEMDFPPPA